MIDGGNELIRWVDLSYCHRRHDQPTQKTGNAADKKIIAVPIVRYKYLQVSFPILLRTPHY